MNKKHILIGIAVLLLIIIIIGNLKNIKMFVVDSGSMQPKLKVGDLIFVMNYSEYGIGDIVTYYDKKFDGYVTHRIIGKAEDGKFIMKGDFNNVEDEEKIDTNEIIGKVVFKSHILGAILYKYKSLTCVLLSISFVLINLYSIRERK